MSRNQGASVPGLDPTAVPLSTPGIAIPNIPAPRYFANNSSLELLSKALGLAGDAAYQVARANRNTGPADRMAEQGMGRLAAVVPTTNLVSAFDNDDVDQLVITPGDVRTGTNRFTVEDQLLGLIEDAEDPNEALRVWAEGQMQGDLERLDTDDARDAYVREFFPKVYRSALNWYAKKSSERQAVFRGEMSERLANGGFKTSPERLVSLSRQDNRYVEPLELGEAVDMIYAASEIAIGEGNFERARELLQSVGLQQRDASWFKRVDEWQSENAASVGRLMLVEAMEPGKNEAAAGIFETLDQDTHPSVVKEAERVASTIMVDPKLTNFGRKQKLEGIIAQVDPYSPAALPFFAAHDQASESVVSDRSEQKKIDDQDAVAVSLRFSLDGEVTEGDVRITSTEQLRQFYVDRYGRSKGMVYFGEHLERGRKPFLNPEESGNAANLHIDHLRGLDTVAARNDYYEENVKPQLDSMSSGDMDRVLRAMKLENRYDPFFNDERFKTAMNNLRREFYEAAGATESNDFAYVVRKGMKEGAHEAWNKLYFKFRGEFRTFLEANYETFEAKPAEFNTLFNTFFTDKEMEDRFTSAASAGATFAPENDS